MLLDMPWQLSWFLIFAALIILFSIGVPIGFAMVAVAMAGLFLSAGFDYVLDITAFYTYRRATPYVFICIPMFVLMTEFMTHGGISTKLIDMSQKLIGRVPGSLAVVAIVASTVFGACCSSTVLGAMIMSEMILPESSKRNYDNSLIAGTIAAGGTLSVLIPPSGTLILWGIIAQVGVDRLFIAGILPGLLAATVFIAYIVIRAIRNPALAPPVPAVPMKEQLLAIAKGWDIILLIVVVLGGIYAGVADVVEISAVGAIFALIIGLFHRKLNLSTIFASLTRTATMVASFIVLIIGAFLLINLMSYLRIPFNLSEFFIDANLSPTILVIAIMVMFFVLGMFIDSASVLLITLPLFYESLVALNVDLVWLGIIVTLNAMIATLTPPVGLNLFVIQTVGKRYGVSFTTVVRGSLPFIGLLALVMVIVWIFPSIATWLPSTMD